MAMQFIECLPQNIQLIVRPKIESFIFREGRHPSPESILDILHKDLEALNNLLSEHLKKNVGGRVYQVQDQGHVTPQMSLQNVQGGQVKTCPICHKKNHEEKNCLRKRNCVLCAGLHRAAECKLYPRQIPQAKACSFCAENLGIELFHPLNQCRMLLGSGGAPPPQKNA